MKRPVATPFAMNRGSGMDPPCFSILCHQSPANSNAIPASSPQINKVPAGQRALRYPSSTAPPIAKAMAADMSSRTGQ
jgi:hypothetical protein